MYSFRERRGLLDLAFTDRHGVDGAGLDLSLQADDADSLRALLADFAPGAGLADMRQVHGAEVAVVDGPGRSVVDGLVTARPGLVLMVRVADCVPVLLADTEAGVVGVAHAGRPGVRAGVVPATVAAMRGLGATRLEAWIGPHVCGRCYEVPAEMQADVVQRVPSTGITTRQGTPGLDLGAGVRSQLADAGVAVTDVFECTIESERLYSYRREGERAGRMAGLVQLREAG